jgi:uncharacterized protein (TIRG00374 family)
LKPNWPRNVKRTVRAVLALAIVGWLAWRIGIPTVLEQIARADIALLFFATVALALDGLMKAWNWQQLLDATIHDQSVRFLRVVKWHFAGGFLGAIVPSSASTDACRVYLGQRGLGGHAVTCAASVVTVNGLGWFTGCALGIFGMGLLLLHDDLPHLLKPAAVLFLVTLAGLPLAYGLLAAKRDAVLSSVDRVAHRWPGLRKGLGKFLDALLVFEQAHVRFPTFLGISTLGLLAQSGMYALTAAAVGVQVPFGVWMVLAPLTRIIALIPISIADFGLIQAAHVSVLTLFGVPAAQSFAISTLFALQGLLVHATLGTSAFVWGGAARKPATE